MEAILRTLRANERLSGALTWQKAEDGLLDLKYAFEQEDLRGFDEAHAKLCTVLGSIMGIMGDQTGA